MNAATPISTARGTELENWRELLRNATRQVFQMMIGSEAHEPEGELPHEVREISGMVGLAGALCGIVTLRCGLPLAEKIAAKLIGAPAAEAAEHTADAIGEMCNVIAGNFKASIPGFEDKCMLSVPTVVSGADYRMHCLEVQDAIEVVLVVEQDPVWITLEIRD